MDGLISAAEAPAIVRTITLYRILGLHGKKDTVTDGVLKAERAIFYLQELALAFKGNQNAEWVVLKEIMCSTYFGTIYHSLFEDMIHDFGYLPYHHYYINGSVVTIIDKLPDMIKMYVRLSRSLEVGASVFFCIGLLSLYAAES